MLRVSLSILLIFCFTNSYAANLAIASSDDYPWKTQPPFEVSGVEGFASSYLAGNLLSFHVMGKSYVDIDAESKNGFSVSAAIYDVPRTKTFQTVAGTYDEAKRGWQIDFTAPTDSSLSYEIEILLYCGKDDSKCAEIYGIAAQTTKRMPLYIR